MDQSEPVGCLGALLHMIGIDLRKLGGARPGRESLPYRRRDDFLSPSERSFFGVLQQAVQNRYLVFAKVRVADLLFVPRGSGSQSAQNRINSKHVDFVVCSVDTVQPVAVIELDDASHSRPDREDRDQFLDDAFSTAGLPLIRFPARRQYDLATVSATIDEAIGDAPTASAGHESGDASMTPACPKCGVPMVVRTAARGAHAGTRFLGCPNYPQCRETADVRE